MLVHEWRRIKKPRGGFRRRKFTPEMNETVCSIVEENNALNWSMLTSSYYSCHSRIEVTFDLVALKKLPPYSPFLNIMENMFSVWKAGVKRRLSDAQPLLPTNRWKAYDGNDCNCCGANNWRCRETFLPLKSTPQCFMRALIYVI